MNSDEALELIEGELAEMTDLLERLEGGRDDDKKKKRIPRKAGSRRSVPHFLDDGPPMSESLVELEVNEGTKAEGDTEARTTASGTVTTTSSSGARTSSSSGTTTAKADPEPGDLLTAHFKQEVKPDTGLSGTSGFDGKDFLVVEKNASGRPPEFLDRKDIRCRPFVTEDGREMKVWKTKESWARYKRAVEQERYREAEKRAKAINNGTIPRPRARYPNSQFIVGSDATTTAKDPNGFTVWYATEEFVEKVNYYCNGAQSGLYWMWEKLAEEGWPIKEIQKRFNVDPKYYARYPTAKDRPPKWDASIPDGELVDTPYYLEKMG
jgi:hypothetical protein